MTWRANEYGKTPTNTLAHVWSQTDTCSKYKLSTNTGPWSHKPSVKAILIIFPPPSPSVKPWGSSRPSPLLCAHLLCWTARLAGEARGRFGARRSGYLALDRLGGWRLDWGGWDASEHWSSFHGDTVLQCLQPPNSVSDLSSPSLYSSTGPLCPSSSNVNVEAGRPMCVSVCMCEGG